MRLADILVLLNLWVLVFILLFVLDIRSLVSRYESPASEEAIYVEQDGRLYDPTVNYEEDTS